MAQQAQQYYPAGTRVLVHQVGFPQHAVMGTVVRLNKHHAPLPSLEWSIVKTDDGGAGCFHKSWLHTNAAPLA